MTEQNFRIERGMEVVDTNDNPVGKLENIFSEDKTGASRFIAVGGHLLPIETIDRVESDRLKLRLPHEKVRSFPSNGPGTLPSRDDQQRAYEIVGLSGPAVERPE